MKKVLRWTIHILVILAILALLAFFIYPKITGKAIFRNPVIVTPSDSTAEDDGGEEEPPKGNCYCNCMDFSTDPPSTISTNEKANQDGLVTYEECIALNNDPCQDNRGKNVGCHGPAKELPEEEVEKPKEGILRKLRLVDEEGKAQAVDKRAPLVRLWNWIF